MGDILRLAKSVIDGDLTALMGLIDALKEEGDDRWVELVRHYANSIDPQNYNGEPVSDYARYYRARKLV